MFRANKLCILASSVHFLLLQEAHGGGLMRHFGIKKTEDILATHLFWPKMRRDIERFVARCTTCQKAKSRLNPHGLYMPLPIPCVPREDISIPCATSSLVRSRIIKVDFLQKNSHHLIGRQDTFASISEASGGHAH